MKHILCKLILPLLCALLLAFTPVATALALGAGDSVHPEQSTEEPTDTQPPPAELPPPAPSAKPTPPPTETTPPPAETTPPPAETTPPPAETTPPPTETTPPPTETTPPPAETTPPPAETTPPPAETTPPPAESTPPPAVSTLPEVSGPPVEPLPSASPSPELPAVTPDSGEEEPSAPSYGITLAWSWDNTGREGASGISYERVWDPSTHSYDGWDSHNNVITVTNDSRNQEEIRVILRFSTGPDGAPMAFAPGEAEADPEDFTVKSDGSIEFVLPRPDGETSAEIFLWPQGDWADVNQTDYQAVGMVQSTFTAVDGVATADIPPFPQPGELGGPPATMPEFVEQPPDAMDLPREEPDPTPPPDDEDGKADAGEEPEEEAEAQPTPAPPEAEPPPKEDTENEAAGPEAEDAADPPQEEQA